MSDVVQKDVVPDTEPPALGISELASMFGITARTIRFYEDQGLLAPRRLGKTRIYGDRDRVRLQLILRGKRLGFSLADIRAWLDLYDLEDGQRRQYEVLLTESRKRIADLEQQRDDLTQTLAELRTMEAFAMEQFASTVVERRPGVARSEMASPRRARRTAAAGQKG